MRKVLVTGATGFIGGYVIKNLLTKGLKVIATSSDKGRAEKKEWFNDVAYAELDLQRIDDSMDYFQYFGEPDIVIHLAWEGLPDYKGDFHISKNLPRHKLLLENMLRNGLQDLTVIGTCLEYGLKEGCLSEDMDCDPVTAYGNAKNELRKYLEGLQPKYGFSLKWGRLFYMYGPGQNPNSLLSQLDRALANGDRSFNMSGGEQERDYLPVAEIAEKIVVISLQKDIEGAINCASGIPVKVKDFIADYLKKKKQLIDLNLGFYQYPDYEPMCFWGNIHKLKKIQIMNDPIREFVDERNLRIEENGNNTALNDAAKQFNTESNKNQYSYNFSWMGRPIIQYPQDMIAMQELIWEIKPDLIIETGIAHGGSLIYYASILELIGKGEVLGIDIDIRSHNKEAIESHPMFRRIKMIQGSSIDQSTVDLVKKEAEGKETIMVCLDSNHTHEHVLRELEFYAPFVSLNSYVVVFDTIVEDLPEGYFTQKRPWGISNNPKTAVYEYLKENDHFIIDKAIDSKLLISVAPEGYLKRIK